MLPLHRVQEIKRLIDQGEESQRQIAKRLGVARGTVQAIASGRRGLHGRETSSHEAEPDLDRPAERCLGCGMLVQMPCVYCRALDYSHRNCRPCARGGDRSSGRAA